MGMLIAIASLHAAASLMIDPVGARACHTRLQALEVLLSQLASSELKVWLNYHSKGSITWLRHGALVDVHSAFQQIALIASLPASQRAIIMGKALKASDALASLVMMLASAMQKWSIMASNNAVGDYNSEPSAWRSMAPPEAPAPKKKPCSNIAPDGNKKSGSWSHLKGAPPPACKGATPHLASSN